MHTKRAFTLIELLVVIAIIGLLAAVIMASLNASRGKAQNAELRTGVRQVQTAINLYYNKYGTMPANQTPGNVYCSNQPNFLQPLIAEGFLKSIPTSQNPICYYDYGSGNDIGAIVFGFLNETEDTSESGYPGTCRPWSSGAGYCSQTASRDYCVCNAY